MAWNPTLSPLRNRLAALYPNEEQARRVVDDAQLDSAYISFSNQAINNWHNILGQAALHDKVEAVVLVALGQYKTDTQLIEAYQAYMAAIGRPATLPAVLLSTAPSAESSPATTPPPQVTQHVGTLIDTGGGAYIAGDVSTGGGDFVGRDQQTNHPPPESYDAATESAGLQALLAQHKNNLLLLRQKKAVYAAGEVPLSLLNQIAHEEQTIAELKASLGLPADETTAAQGGNATNPAPPRASRLTAMKRQRLQTTLDDLTRQWEAVDRELRGNNDTVARDRLQLRLTQLEEDIAKAEAELEALP